MRKRDDQFTEAEVELDASAVQAVYAELSTAEPPALLDQTVLNLARREAGSSPARQINTRHWIGALSTAFVLVLSLSLLLQSGESPPESSNEESSSTESAKAELSNGKALLPPAAEQERDELRAMQDQATTLPEQSTTGAAAPMESEAAAPVESTNARVMKSSAAKSADYSGDPAAWLQRILQLQQAGEVAQVATELQAFRAAYPDYPLPQALQD